MSLRCVGNQLLQTAPTVLLDGASTASASFFVCVNTGNDVVAASGVEVFGDTGGVFSARISGAGLLRLQWTAAGGMASTCAVGLVPGTAYHVASTWQSGTQRYFVDGVEIASDIQMGALAPHTTSGARPFRLGSDQTGTDVTLSRPTLWLGYTLTASDVLALRDATSAPGSIASASIALEWSLDGTDGVTAAIGDAGLADASPHRLALTTIVGSAPAYKAGDLAYQAGPVYGPVSAAPSGQAIVLIAQDSEGNPLNISSVQQSVATQSIRLLGRPVNDQIKLTFAGSTTTPIATTTTQPTTYFLWTFPTVAGHSYDLSVTWWSNWSPRDGAVNFYFETLDGNATLATYLQPIWPDPNIFVASEVPNVYTNPDGSGGFPVWWLPVTPSAGVRASGSSLSVRETSENSQMYMSGLRVVDLTTGVISHYNLTDQANFSVAPASGTWSVASQTFYYGGQEYQGFGLGDYGPTTVINPQGGSNAAAVLTSALQSLAPIGPTNVSVIDESGTGTYQVDFLNNLASSAQPAITCTDPAVTVSIIAPGGQGFTLNQADGTALLLTDVVWSESKTCPYVLLPLPQAKPEVQTWIVRNLPCSNPAYWDGADYSLTSSLSKNPIFGWSAGLTLSFPAQRLPVGTYQWAITWPNQPFSLELYGTEHSYDPSTATQFLVQDGSGNTLATYSVDQTQAPSSYTDANGTPWHLLGSFEVATRDETLTLVMTSVGQSAASSGQVQVVAILDAVQFTRTSADTSVVVGPGDSLSIPAGFAATTSGPLPAMVDMPIAPASPTAIMPAFEEAAKSMKLGWGIIPAYYYCDFPIFSNLAYLMVTMGTSQDANGYPTRFHGSWGQFQATISNTISNANGFGKPFQGTTFTPAGKYILAWDGQTAVSLVSHDDSTTVTPIASSKPAGTPANWQVYNVSFDPNLTSSPRLDFRMNSSIVDATDSSGQTYEVTVSNLLIYPPDPADPTGQTVWGLSADGSKWTSPPKFYPDYLAKLSGANCLRFMDPLCTNAQPVFEFAHFKPDTHANRTVPTLWSNLADGQSGYFVNVASIRGATAAESPTLPNYGAVVVIETTVPNNFYDGCFFNFLGCGEGNFSESYNNAGPVTVPLDSGTGGLSGYVIGVIDATHLLAVVEYSHGSMTNTTTGGSLCSYGFGTAWSLDDIVDLIKAVGTSVSRLHFNVPMTIDTSNGGALAQLAAWVAANLPPWVTELAVEPGNEVWNNAFIANDWASVKSLAYGGDPSGYVGATSHAPFYARQSKTFHDAFVNAFEAAGRPGIVRRLFGSFAGFPATTNAIVSTCKTIGASVDEICVAFYIQPGPAAGYDADQLSIFDRMTTGQLLDYAELAAEYGGWPGFFVTNQYEALQQAGLTQAKVVGYEGSMSCMVPIDPVGGSPPGNTPDYVLRMHAARRHPRMYGIMLRHAQTFQDAGTTAWCYFEIGGEASFNPWATFESDTQPFGTGNPVTDSIGITDPMNINAVPNQIAGGLRAWANLVPAPTAPGGGAKPFVIRNGRLRATGLFRGVAHTTRSR